METSARGPDFTVTANQSSFPQFSSSSEITGRLLPIHIAMVANQNEFCCGPRQGN